MAQRVDADVRRQCFGRTVGEGPINLCANTVREQTSRRTPMHALPAHSIFSPLLESVTTAYLVTSAPVPAVVGTATIGNGAGGVSVSTGAL